MRERPYLVLFLAPVLVYLAVLLLVAVVVAKPSPLGWLGFGVAAAIGMLVAAAASVLYPRSRANAPRLHPHPDEVFRLLVVADTQADGTRLSQAVEHAVGGRPAQVVVLSPVLPSPLHFLTDAERAEEEDARTRLGESLRELERLGIPVRGVPGGDEPLQAIGDALSGFPADEVLLAVAEPGRRTWLEHDLERTVRDIYGVHVSTLTVERPAAASV